MIIPWYYDEWVVKRRVSLNLADAIITRPLSLNPNFTESIPIDIKAVVYSIGYITYARGILLN